MPSIDDEVPFKIEFNNPHTHWSPSVVESEKDDIPKV